MTFTFTKFLLKFTELQKSNRLQAPSPLCSSLYCVVVMMVTNNKEASKPLLTRSYLKCIMRTFHFLIWHLRKMYKCATLITS